MEIAVIDEPALEFGYSGTHVEQRAGLVMHGPADIEMDGRCGQIRIGVVGSAAAVDDVRSYLRACCKGIAAKDTELIELFPAFPGCDASTTFRCRLTFGKTHTRSMSSTTLAPIVDAETDDQRIRAGVEICSGEIRRLVERSHVDVVIVARPNGIPDGVDATGKAIGANFHDLLKAAVNDVPAPIQIIRSATWKGGAGVEDDATRAWNLFAALFYKAGGKPWRLRTSREEKTRCFVGISFTRITTKGHLFASVAQVFNELGDGVIVRGAIAEEDVHDRQPHLARSDAAGLLTDALERYRETHGNLPACLTIHKTSSFSTNEQAGFTSAAHSAGCACEMVWLTSSDNTMLIRGSKTYPPLRGTLLTLDDDQHVLYTHGSVPYYRTYPGLYVPRPLGIRPCLIERSITEVAEEILALTKLNWNRARMEARWPITLLTARRVGEILRHLPEAATAAPEYSKYM
jgi:hypothetical protein